MYRINFILLNIEWYCHDNRNGWKRYFSALSYEAHGKKLHKVQKVPFLPFNSNF
jgi:hypothetical protein